MLFCLRHSEDINITKKFKLKTLRNLNLKFYVLKISAFYLLQFHFTFFIFFALFT